MYVFSPKFTKYRGFPLSLFIIIYEKQNEQIKKNFFCSTCMSTQRLLLLFTYDVLVAKYFYLRFDFKW